MFDWITANKIPLGVWLKLVLMIGLCVFLSTELGGIISVLCAAMLYIGGTPGVRDTIEEIAVGKNVGGGPLESFYRIVNRGNIAAPLEETTPTKVATGSDDVFRWFLRTFRPRYHLHGHVHVYDNRTVTRTRFCDTEVLNAYRYRQLNLLVPAGR